MARDEWLFRQQPAEERLAQVLASSETLLDRGELSRAANRARISCSEARSLLPKLGFERDKSRNGYLLWRRRRC